MDKEKTQEQTMAYDKGVAIIASCTTCDHFDNAVSYLDLFFGQFKDREAYQDLMVLYVSKKKELNCYE